MKVICEIEFDNEPSPADIPHIQHLLDNDTKYRAYTLVVKDIV